MPDLDLDLTNPELYRQGFPHQIFADLRAQGAVFRHPKVSFDSKPEGLEFWALVRHAEVQQANRDWMTFSALSGPSIGGAPPERVNHQLFVSDPPTHTRLRKLISSGFTRRMIARLEEGIGAWTTRILDAAAESGEVDFVRDIAYVLPMHVIADIIGIPESDRPWVFARTETFMRAPDPMSGLTMQEREQAQLEVFGYAQELSAEKRKRPTYDIWSLLTFAEIEDEDGSVSALSSWELDLFFMGLSLAGSETTRNAMSQGLMALVEHPDQMEAMRINPELLETGVDEILRWASPVMCFGRTARRDVQLSGEIIRSGDRITMWYPSANRDATVFGDPFRFDLTRHPNPHVAFGGGGVHHCLGAHLARREITVMFEQMLPRFEIEITGPPRWCVTGPDHSVGVSVDRLPVRLSPR